MIPKHKSPKSSNRWAHAAYNFIPLPEAVVPAEELPDQNTYHSDRHTGQIVCDLETETPLYTRGAVRRELFKRYEKLRLQDLKNSADVRAYAAFFRYDENGKPVISGSSLRGMIRSLCEIISYSKVQWVTDKGLIYRAVGSIDAVGEMYRQRFFGSPDVQPLDGRPEVSVFRYPAKRVRGGYLIKQGSDWYIQPAEQDKNGSSFAHVNYNDCKSAGLMTSDEHNPETCPVWIAPPKEVRTKAKAYGTPPNERWLAFRFIITKGIQRYCGEDSPPAEGWRRGVLVLSHHFGDKKSKHPKHRNIVIYKRDDQAKPLPVKDDILALLMVDEDLPRREEHKPRGITEQDGAPVMYMVDDNGEVVFLGPTKMFRLPYRYTPLDFVPPELREEKVIDLAEAVFGFTRDRSPDRNETVEQAKRRAYASRVFFGDALLQNNTDQQQLYVPQVLSAPKPTSFQLYLTQDAQDDTTATRGRYLFHYEMNPADRKTVIRGIKQYWHKSDERARDSLSPKPESFTVRDLERRDQNSRTVIRPVSRGAKFRFTIRFENLSDVELGMLMWALQLPAGDDLRHHLGMAKNYGLGTVKITPYLYLENRQERYKSLFTKKGDGSLVWSSLTETRDTSQAENGDFYRKAFETYVIGILKQKGVTNGGSLSDQPRIQDLITMLRYPGPEDTDCGDFNSQIDKDMFRYRNVLPNPREVDHPVTGREGSRHAEKPRYGNQDRRSGLSQTYSGRTAGDGSWRRRR